MSENYQWARIPKFNLRYAEVDFMVFPNATACEMTQGMVTHIRIRNEGRSDER